LRFFPPNSTVRDMFVDESLPLSLHKEKNKQISVSNLKTSHSYLNKILIIK
jgi:hypothetical protein